MNTPGPSSGKRPAEEGDSLRRPTDRLQTAVSRMLLVILLVGLPAAALTAGWMTYTVQMRTVREETADRHRVTARLLTDARDGARAAGEDLRWAQVGWTEPNGTARTDRTQVASDATKDTTLRIWVNNDGAITAPPTSPTDAKTSAWLIGGITATLVGSVLLATRAGVAAALDRRRYAQWDAAWAAVEPQWSGRLHR